MRSSKRVKKMGWRELWPIWLTFAAIFGVGAAGVWILTPKPERPILLSNGQDLRLNLSQLDPARPKLFAYGLGPESRADFFVERTADSKITVAFASCRRCYRSGYYRQDGRILCGRCNELMARLEPGQLPGPEKDCTHIPIPFVQSSTQLTVYGRSISEAFARWYAPVL